MKALALAAAGCILASAAMAQRPPLQEQVLPPLQLPIAPTSPLAQPQAEPQPQAATPEAQQPAAPPPNLWLPAGAAKLQALDKVNGQATNFTVKVGQSASFGSLTIQVQACVVRPSDRPADAAAFVDVTDSHPDSAGFKGWLLENEPAVSMMQNPIYDLRVAGCA